MTDIIINNINYCTKIILFKILEYPIKSDFSFLYNCVWIKQKIVVVIYKFNKKQLNLKLLQINKNWKIAYS